MKSLIIVLLLLLLSTLIKAQTPNQFICQAVLRNADGTIMAHESVIVGISILQGNISDISVFGKQHSVITSAQGLINLNIRFSFGYEYS